ncbi:hypothetical protein I9018_28730 [Pseudomonas sp. MPFS]|uniref:hypothetical protein n=1 Tax=Pseudomonas sp. MPFS TaxID=2795724 RepID=UPI001F135035|nr:hypothetical protein [Pseudomonas sp. MPFS]UMZ11413.1 hypothetical protein I9018_28730 [Pseudomonas sp. MPFS]
MVRIHGSIGDWPVDLTLELDEDDWARLAGQLGGQLQAGSAAQPVATGMASKPASQDDTLWQTAKDLLCQAGQMSGPELLEQLEGLTGSAAAGKRLLVRLRHCAQVKVISGADTPIYHWVP